MKEERVVSGPGFGLVIGAQTKAAGYVVDFESNLVDVADMLESCILDDVARVNGPYVSVLSDALQRWGEGANAHQADLERYAQALISVDEALVTAEEDASGDLNDIALSFRSVS
jgi:hypothetical protein